MSLRVKAHLALLASAIIFAINYWVSDNIVSYIGVIPLVFFRTIGATILFFFLYLFEKDRIIPSLCKKTPNTALFSFLKQSFTNVNSLVSKTSKALSLVLSY